MALLPGNRALVRLLAAAAAALVAVWPALDGPSLQPLFIVLLWMAALVPAAPLYLLVFSLRQGKEKRPLSLAVATGAAVAAAAAYCAVDALGDVAESGLRPIVWAAGIALVNLALAATALAGLMRLPVRGRALAVGGAALGVSAWLFLTQLAWSLVLGPHGGPWRRLSANEGVARSSVRSAASCLMVFSSIGERGYPARLEDVASFGDVCSVLLRPRSPGYRFEYTPGTPDASGLVRAFTLTARPIRHRRTGLQSFRLDETFEIRWTGQDRPPTASDPVVQ